MKPTPTGACHNCRSEEITPIFAKVPPINRFRVGKLVGIDYSLGPGSGIEIPMRLCMNCGQIQRR